MKALLAEGYDAIFVGSGAPRGRDLDIPGRQEAAANIHIGIDWLASVSFGHVDTDRPARHRARRRQHRDGLLPHRAAPRRRGRARSSCARGFEEMKASPWEKEDAMHEGIPILNFLVPKSFTPRRRQADRRDCSRRCAPSRRRRAAASWCRPASPTCTSSATTCWSRSARRTRSRGSSATSASSSTSGACRSSTRSTMQSTLPNVFFGGDAAFGPKNIIWAVAHGHEAAISIDKLCHGEDSARAPAAAREPRVAEDGHPRVELRQRDHAGRRATRCR